jgi:single-strand DNA-binding protein
MQAFNRIILIGRLVADPEVRYAPTGKAIVTFRLAVNRPPRTSPTGERIEETDFFRVVVFRESLVNFVSTYLTKGRLVLVEGEMRMRRWKNDIGDLRTTYEVVAFKVEPLDRKPESSESESVEPGSIEEEEEEIIIDEDLNEDEPPY